MGGQSPDTMTLRVERPELTRLGWALLVSLVLHLFCWGTYAVGKKYHLWERLKMPDWVLKLTTPPVQPQVKQPVNREPPLMFVEVIQPSAEVPKETDKYSDKNSIASNPEVNQASNIPKIDGTQENVPKTEDA